MHSACSARRIACSPIMLAKDESKLDFHARLARPCYDLTFLTFVGLKAGPAATFFCSSSSSTICCRVCSGGHFLSPLKAIYKATTKIRKHYHLKLSFPYSNWILFRIFAAHALPQMPQIRNTNCSSTCHFDLISVEHKTLIALRRRQYIFKLGESIIQIFIFHPTSTAFENLFSPLIFHTYIRRIAIILWSFLFVYSTLLLSNSIFQSITGCSQPHTEALRIMFIPDD